jgi:hypothetical protein
VAWNEDEQPDVATSDGKRPDQIVFSVVVVIGSLVLGLLAGSMYSIAHQLWGGTP